MNENARQALYAISTILTGVVTLLVLFKVIDAGQAASVNQLLSLIAGAFGTSTTAVAAVKVRSQKRARRAPKTP